MLPQRLLLALLLAISAAAQPASDLLQSGVFAQETLGDLDAAIRIYRQILSSGPGLRLYTGQAQYRLGICLLRKGDVAGGTRALEAVIKDYPDQHELVARARENMPRGHSLLPAPWGETEVSEYRWTIPGVTDGWSISRIAASAKDKRTLHIQTNFYGPQLSVTMVDADRETMRPISGTYRGPNAQNARTPVHPSSPPLRQATLIYSERAAPESSGIFRFTLSPPARPGIYVHGELLYVLRRVPLAEGWSSDIPLITPQRNVVSDAGPTPTLHAEVTGIERVVVPAGAFQCYKVHLSAGANSPPRSSSLGLDWPRPAEGETLWYAIDGARSLVKIQSGSALGELTGLRTADPTGTTTYRDSHVGYSFTLPPGWVYHSRTAITGPGSSVDLIDPESQAVVIISGRSKETSPDRIESELRAGAADVLVRSPDTIVKSSTLSRLGGHQALIEIEAHALTTRVGYATWIQSESTRVSIRCQLEAADLESFRRRFQPILDSFRMP